MTTEQREQIRLSILRYCDSAQGYGLAEPLLVQFLRNEGFRRLTAAQLTTELAYLAEKGFLAIVSKAISPENKLWRITAAGRDLRALQNQEEA